MIHERSQLYPLTDVRSSEITLKINKIWGTAKSKACLPFEIDRKNSQKIAQKKNQATKGGAPLFFLFNAYYRVRSWIAPCFERRIDRCAGGFIPRGNWMWTELGPPPAAASRHSCSEATRRENKWLVPHLMVNGCSGHRHLAVCCGMVGVSVHVTESVPRKGFDERIVKRQGVLYWLQEVSNRAHHFFPVSPFNKDPYRKLGLKIHYL